MSENKKCFIAIIAGIVLLRIGAWVTGFSKTIHVMDYLLAVLLAVIVGGFIIYRTHKVVRVAYSKWLDNTFDK